MKQDIVINDQGTIMIFTPQTDDALHWIEKNIGRANGYQPYWPSVVVERRYVEGIVEGMLEDGLEVG